MIIESGNRYRHGRARVSRMRVVMSINSVKGQTVQSRRIEVLPAQIHSHGIQFVTPLDLPAYGEYTLRLELSSRHYRRTMTAVVVWKRETKGGYLYGCSFRGGQRLHMSVRHSWEEERARSAPGDCFIYDGKGVIRNASSNYGLAMDVSG